MKSSVGDRHSWSEIHSRRLQWAYDGWKGFVDQLKDLDVQNLYRQRKHGRPIIVTYGPPQQGKTTVLLQLLGLDPESKEAKNVERVLRGNRTLGKSATASALRYLVSPDSSWHLSFDDNVLDTSDDTRAEEFMNQLRAKIGHRYHASARPARIEIPRHYVARPQENTVIDLPGIGSSDKSEQLHVQAVMERWFPVASTILIVLVKRNLSELLYLKGLQYNIQPSRYRLVLTYAVSDDSDIEFVSRAKEINLDLESWRDHYRPDILRTIPDFPDRLAIFPFEVGDSRREMKNKKPWIKPLLAASERAICESLDVTPEAALAQQAGYYPEVDKYYRDKRASREAEIRKRAESILAAEHRLKQYRKIVFAAGTRERQTQRSVQEWLNKTVQVSWDGEPTPPSTNDKQQIFRWALMYLEPWVDERIADAFRIATLPVPESARISRRNFSADLQWKLRNSFGRFAGMIRGADWRAGKYRIVTKDILERLKVDIEKEAAKALAQRHQKAVEEQQKAHNDRLLAISTIVAQRKEIRQLTAEHRRAVEANNSRSASEAEELERIRRFWDHLDTAWLRQDEQLCKLFQEAHHRPLDRLYIALERGIRSVARQRLLRVADEPTSIR